MKGNRNLILAGLIFATLTLLAASWFINEKQEDYRSAVMLKIAEQETKMVRISELINRGSADSATNQVIEDCVLEDRERFDTLLSNLPSLNRTELSEIETLFAACGSYFADRQAMLAVRFTREVEVYSEYISLLELTDTDIRTFDVKKSKWQELNELEKQKSLLALELVKLQGDIIDLLIEGNSINSDLMVEKVQAAQSSKETLSILVTKANALRSEINQL